MDNLDIDKGRYHKNKFINKQIRSLFTWFDVSTKELPPEYKIEAVNNWIKTLEKHEKYELAKAFSEYKKPELLGIKINKSNWLSRYINKIKNFFK